MTMSLEDFLTYDDGTHTRYELEDGVLVEMGTESPLNTWIAIFLIQHFTQLGLEASQFGFKHLIQVDSTYVTARDPDLIIHSESSAIALDDGRKEACLKLGEPNPLIVIEIISPGTKRAIPEMWQIDPTRSWVKIGTLTNGTYDFQTFIAQDTIFSPTFSQLTLTATEILKAGRP
jgi:Uma2 family endonuclease